VELLFLTYFMEMKLNIYYPTKNIL